jgi:hypothetical protein
MQNNFKEYHSQEFHKKWITEILNNNVHSIYDFINKLDYVTNTKYSNPDSVTIIIEGKSIGIYSSSEIYFVDFENIKKIEGDLINFINLYKYLCEKDFILTEKMPNVRFKPFFTLDKSQSEKLIVTSPTRKLNYFNYKYSDTAFFATNELHEYANRNYKTEQQYYYEEENKDRKKAQRLTIIIALGSLLLTAFMNYFTFTNKREVEILNLKDTSKVILLNTVKDTSKTDSNIVK